MRINMLEYGARKCIVCLMTQEEVEEFNSVFTTVAEALIWNHGLNPPPPQPSSRGSRETHETVMTTM